MIGADGAAAAGGGAERGDAGGGEAAAHDLGATGSVVGRLSAWATAGGLAGTFATGFVSCRCCRPTSRCTRSAARCSCSRCALGRGGAPWSGSVIGLVAAALVLGGAAVAVGVPCDAETRYHCARVERDPQRPSGRTLVLEDLKHSYVDLDDPRRLEFDYVRWIGDAIDGVAAARRAARRRLPRRRRLHAPALRARDAARLAVARARGRRRARRLRARAARAAHRPRPARAGRRRARDAAGEPPASAESLVGDAFGGRAVPWHLATVEFARDVRRVLRPGRRLRAQRDRPAAAGAARAEAATLLEVFGDVALVARRGGGGGPAGGNLVLLASETTLPPDGCAALPRRAQLDRAGGRTLRRRRRPAARPRRPRDQLTRAVVRVPPLRYLPFAAG